MYTIQEVADIFHVSYGTAYSWVTSGRIKSVKIGGIIRISEEEVERIKRGE